MKQPLQFHWALATIVIGAALLRIAGLPWGFTVDQKWHYEAPIHDDERRELRAIAQLDPAAGDINPDDAQREGPLHPYVVAAALLFADGLGTAHLTGDTGYYQEHPTAMRRLYLIGRAVSVAADLAALVVVYWIGATIATPAAGLAAALLLALAPVHVVQSTYMRSYSLANLFMLLSLAAALRLVRGDLRVRWTTISALAAGLATATRFSMLFTLAFAPAAVLVVWIRQWRTGARPALSTFRAHALALFPAWILGVIAGNPALLTEPGAVLASMRTNLTYGGDFTSPLTRLAGIATALTRTTSKAMTFPFYALGLAGLLGTASARRLGLGWLALAFTAPYAYIMFGGDYAGISRFTMVFTPFLALGAGFAAAAALQSSQKYRVGFVLFLTMASVYALAYDVAHVRAARAPHPLAEAASWIDRSLPASTPIGLTYRHAYAKFIDFDRHQNTIELGDDLASLAEYAPPVVITVPFLCCDFYPNDTRQETLTHALTTAGYKRTVSFRGDDPVLFGISFKNRVDRALEYPVEVWERQP